MLAFLVLLSVVCCRLTQSSDACNVVNITGCEASCEFDDDSSDATNQLLVTCEKSGLSSVPSESLCVQLLKIEKNDIHFVEHVQFTCLRKLFLDSNNIQVINSDAFDGLSDLTELSLASNDINTLSGVQFRGVVNLKALYLDHNPLAKIITETFTRKDFAKSLEVLSLSFCSLHTIEPLAFSAFDSLRILNVSHNDLISVSAFFASFDAQGLPELQYLDISYNSLNDLGVNYFGRLPAVKQLFLTHNKITMLSSHTFAGAENSLHALHLNHNNISSIEPKSLGEFGALIYADLSYNRLESLAEDTFNWTKDFRIILHNNPWQCTCDIEWMTRLGNAQGGNFNTSITYVH